MSPSKAKPAIVEVPQEWNETCQVLRHHVPFVTEALGVMPLIAVDDMEHPAITDGTAIILCPSKWDEIRKETQAKNMPWFPTEACGRAVLILHELYHPICKHTSAARRGHRKLEKWQIAADMVANEMVVDTLRMPPFNYKGAKLDQLEAALMATGCYDKRYHGKTVEEVYELLPEGEGGGGEGKPNKQQSSNHQEQQDQEQQPEQDQQDDQEKQDKEQDEQKQDGDGDPQSGEPEDEDGEGNGAGNQPSDISELFGDDLDTADAPQSDIPDDIKELVDNALQNYMERHGHKLHSPDGSFNGREVSEAAKKPPVRLEDVLRKIRDVIPRNEYRFDKLGETDAWMMRRGMNMRMPTQCPTDSRIVREMLDVLDASGSMDEVELAAANRIVLESLDHVAKHQVRRLVFTTKVEDDCIVKKGSPLPPIKWTGGTNIGCIIDYIEKHKIKPSVIILITDAEDSQSVKDRFAQWKYLSKLRTIIFKNPRGTFPGITFHVDTLE